MTDQPALFKNAGPFQEDITRLPVLNIDTASAWYCKSFGMREIERNESPIPRVLLERDGVTIGFAETGGDSTQDGAAILVSDAERARTELRSNGIKTGNWRVDERDGQQFQVFFVVAPDGLCFYFHQLIC